MRRKALLLSCLLLLLSGCAIRAAVEASAPPEGAYRVYFASDGLQESGAAVDYEYRVPAGGEEPWRGLLTLLLSGPEGEGLRSPFPQGVTCLAQLREGTVYVNFSEQYGELSGIDLTVANCCVALTLCQVEGVDGVSFTVEGEELPAQSLPDSRVLTAGDVVLSGDEEKPVSVDVTLWYPRADGGGLAERYRTLVLTEDDSLPEALLLALSDTGEEEGLLSAVPPESEIRRVVTEGGICYVDLSAAFKEGLPLNPVLAAQAVRCVVNTLCGNVESVTAVQFQIDGEPVRVLGGLPASAPIEPRFGEENELTNP